MSINNSYEDVLKHLGKYFKLKPVSLVDSDMYLRAKLLQMKLQNGVRAWSLISAHYAHELVKNKEKYLSENLDAMEISY